VPTGQPPKTFISDLRPSRAATIEATVVQLEPPREVPARNGGKTVVLASLQEEAVREDPEDGNAC
jgi:hypothetical protein